MCYEHLCYVQLDIQLSPKVLTDLLKFCSREFQKSIFQSVTHRPHTLLIAHALHAHQASVLSTQFAWTLLIWNGCFIPSYGMTHACTHPFGHTDRLWVSYTVGYHFTLNITCTVEPQVRTFPGLFVVQQPWGLFLWRAHWRVGMDTVMERVLQCKPGSPLHMMLVVL